MLATWVAKEVGRRWPYAVFLLCFGALQPGCRFREPSGDVMDAVSHTFGVNGKPATSSIRAGTGRTSRPYVRVFATVLDSFVCRRFRMVAPKCMIIAALA